MAGEPYLIDPALLALDGSGDWAGETPPLALVELDRLAASPVVLPPFPVIGLGDPAHPAAGWVDAVIEPPVSVARLVAQVTRNPNAAAALVQLLRSIDGLAANRALVLESQCYAMLQGSAEHTAWRALQPGGATAPAGRLHISREDDVLRIVIDRPAARNAIDVTLRDALSEAFTLAALDRDIRRVEWRSVGPAFSVGAELAEFGTTLDPATAHRIRGLTLPAHPLSRCAERVEVHVQGACVGSALEMAAFAGRMTASPAAWFQLPELAMGVIPGAGGCVSVARRIGRHRAALMILSGKRIDAATALRWGLVDALVDLPAVDPGGADLD